MERHVMWASWNERGLEHLRLVQHDEIILADGLIIGVKDNAPFRAKYKIRCDSKWRVRELNLELLNGSGLEIKMQADGEGHWATPSGDSLSSLEGCIDVDISATPFTNTLAIRRMALKPGQSSELTVAYITVPEMELTPVRQRYTCLDLNSQGGLYKYEGLFRGFTAELPVDSDGLVIDYHDTFKRVWPR